MYIVESAITGQPIRLFDNEDDADRFAQEWFKSTGEECFVSYETWWA